jgi:hypothetical protein
MTSKFVIKYNLTSFRNRDDVQAFFGRPITLRRLGPGLASCISRPCLRLTVVQGSGDVGLVDRTESAGLNTDDIAVDGLVLNWLEGDGIVRDGIKVDEHGVEELMALGSWGRDTTSGRSRQRL